MRTKLTAFSPWQTTARPDVWHSSSERAASHSKHSCPSGGEIPEDPGRELDPAMLGRGEEGKACIGGVGLLMRVGFVAWGRNVLEGVTVCVGDVTGWVSGSTCDVVVVVVAVK